jgi:hypothetical protein
MAVVEQVAEISRIEIEAGGGNRVIALDRGGAELPRIAPRELVGCDKRVAGTGRRINLIGSRRWQPISSAAA